MTALAIAVRRHTTAGQEQAQEQEQAQAQAREQEREPEPDMVRDRSGERRGDSGAAPDRGLGLIELLAVLAIAAILATIALPAMGQMVRAYRMRLAAAELLGAVELARGQAIALGHTVLVAPSAPSLDWSDGWSVFIDRNGDRRPDPGDLILMLHPALAAPLRFTMQFGSQQGPPYLAYNSMGRGCNHANSLASRFGTLTVSEGGAALRIKINMLGRARLCNPARDGAACDGADF